jgi:hypothetical protein
MLELWHIHKDIYQKCPSPSDRGPEGQLPELIGELIPVRDTAQPVVDVFNPPQAKCNETESQMLRRWRLTTFDFLLIEERKRIWALKHETSANEALHMDDSVFIFCGPASARYEKYTELADLIRELAKLAGVSGDMPAAERITVTHGGGDVSS